MTTVLAAVMMLIISLSVDIGRAKLAKSELQYAVDAAARYGAGGVYDGTHATRAIAAAAENRVDGTALTLQAADVELGYWNTSAKTFTVTSTNANAIRVTGKRTTARGNAIELYFTRYFGRMSVDVTATSIAMLGSSTYSTTSSTNTTVSGQSSIYYANLANGTQITDPWGYDQVGSSGVVANRISGMSLVAGSTLTFTASGGVNPTPGDPEYYGPEGSPYWYQEFINQSQTPWMSNIVAPGMGMVAVFMDDSTPNASMSAPTAMDYSGTGPDYTLAAPKLRQPFFVGDGVNADGSSRKIIVPPGATRLYFGSMDAYIWRDNAGSFSVTTTQVTPKVIMVK